MAPAAVLLTSAAAATSFKDTLQPWCVVFVWNVSEAH